MIWIRRVLVTAAAAFALCGRPALAQANMNLNGLYFSVGPNLGYGFERAMGMGHGGLFGLETSLVRVVDTEKLDNVWFGAYTDLVATAAGNELHWTIGPEVGYAFFGIDGGYLFATSKVGSEQGFVVRPMLTIGIFTAYFRLGKILTGDADRFGEVGMLLKLPFLLRRFW